MGTLCNGIKNINDIMESKDEDHQTEEPTVSVSNGSSLADLDEKEHQEEGITDEAAVCPAGTAMKLVIRSPYWGRVLKGKPRRDQYNSGRPYRIFQCQAILNQKGRYWGCCPNHGKRVLELKEYHFTECYPHNWDLYMIGSCVQPSSVVHSFFLLPQNQMVVDIDSHLQLDGWRYFGTIQASALRIDLESLLYDFLAQNNDYGFNFHHVHIDLLMDEVTDREAESNRLKTQTRRAERLQHQQQRAANGGNIGKNGIEHPYQSGSVNPPPGIPHVISSDASWSAETIRSNNMTAGGGPENWNDPSFHPAFGFRTQLPNGPPPFSHGQWVTAAASVGNQHMLGPNHNAAASAGQPMPPVQQALQNFPMPQGGVQQFQMGYVPPAHTYYHPPTYGQQHVGGSVAAPQPLPEGWSSTESTIAPHCVPASSGNAAGTTHSLAEEQQPQQQRDDSVP